LFYVLKKREVILLNELFDIDTEYLKYFTDFIFDKYYFVHTITVNRIHEFLVKDLAYPCVVKSGAEDIILQLPANLKEYESTLSGHTKKNLHFYINRFQRDHKDFVYDVRATNEIDPDSISSIIVMNRIRMTSKKIVSGFDLSLERKIIDFCRKYGLVCTIAVNGKVIAGTITYIVGNHAYLETISHDQAYNKCRVGQICLFWTIKTLIERGLSHFHMLWGEYEYKYRFKGVRHRLNTVLIFRRSGLLYYRAKFSYYMGQQFSSFKRFIRLNIYNKIIRIFPSSDTAN
jgi:hypothetical protein